MSDLTWFTMGNEPDALIFIPKRSIMLCGFTTFAAKDTESYDLMYEVRVDGVVREGDII